MTDPRLKSLHLRPDSPWTWLVAAVALVLVATLAVVFFTAFLVLLGVGVIVGPIVAWWRRRKGVPARRPPGGRVIDVEYEVKDNDVS